MRDDTVESLQEAVDLLPYGLGHPHLCHQLDILTLYIYIYINIYMCSTVMYMNSNKLLV